MDENNQVPATTPREASVQTQEAFTPAAEQQPVPNASDKGWSWGAFMLNFKFLIAIRRYMLILLFLIPLVNIFMIFYLGFKGREMAAESKTFANRDEYIGFMKGVDHLGKVMFYILLIGLLVGVAIFTILGSVIPSSLDASRERALTAQFKQEVVGTWPKLILECENGIPSIPNDTEVATWSVSWTEAPNCGPTGEGTFTIKATATEFGLDCAATLSEEGAEFYAFYADSC